MKPTNEKSLFHFLCDVIDKVANKEIDYNEAQTICNVSKEMQKLLEGERKRTALLMKLDEHERNYGKRPELRELASIGFDNTTIDHSTGNKRTENVNYDNFKSVNE